MVCNQYREEMTGNICRNEAAIEAVESSNLVKTAGNAAWRRISWREMTNG